MDNIRRRIVGVMFPPSIVERRLSKNDVSPLEDRCVALRRSMSRCVDLRRSIFLPSKTDDRCVDLRRSVIDVSMCRPSNM